MSARRRTFTREFKLQVLEEVDAGIPVKELCMPFKTREILTAPFCCALA